MQNLHAHLLTELAHSRIDEEVRAAARTSATRTSATRRFSGSRVRSAGRGAFAATGLGAGGGPQHHDGQEPPLGTGERGRWLAAYLRCHGRFVEARREGRDARCG